MFLKCLPVRHCPCQEDQFLLVGCLQLHCIQHFSRLEAASAHACSLAAHAALCCIALLQSAPVLSLPRPEGEVHAEQVYQLQHCKAETCSSAGSAYAYHRNSSISTPQKHGLNIFVSTIYCTLICLCQCSTDTPLLPAACMHGHVKDS